MLKSKLYITTYVLFFSLKLIGEAVPVYLDASFGPNQNGTVVTAIGDNSATYTISLEAGQDILAAGYSGINQIVARYKKNGDLDPSFGTDGIASTVFGENSVIYSAVVQAGGKLVTAGISVISGIPTLTLTRYTTTGVLDGSFGSSGSTFVPLGDGSGAYSIALQNMGNMLVVAGVAVINGIGNLLLAQFDSNGIIDPGFGSLGTITTVIGTSCAVRAISIQSNGNILIAGTANTVTGPVIFVSRYTPTGTLDTTFGTNGVTTTAVPGTIVTTGTTLGLQSDGKIIIAGSTRPNGSDVDNGIVVRYTTSGIVDTTFGSNGIVTIASDSSKNVMFNSLQVDTNDSIIVAGFKGSDSLVIKLTSSGELDNTFGSSGVVSIILTNGSIGTGITIQEDDKYLVAGYVNLAENSNPSILIARVLSSNTPFILIETPANGLSLISATTPIQGSSSYAQAGVQLTLNGVSLTPVSTSNTGFWSYGTSPLLVNGANTLTVNLYDGSTLLATDTSSFTVSTTNNIMIQEPQNGSTLTSNTVTINGTSTQANQTVRVYIDGVLFNTVATSTSGDWDAGTSSFLTNSAHTITAELYEGATLLASSTANILVNGKNIILISAPVKGSTITTSTTPITGTSSGNMLDVNIFIDGMYFTTVTTTTTGDWNAGTSPTLSNGNHIVLAQLTNALGEVIAIVTNKFAVSI